MDIYKAIEREREREKERESKRKMMEKSQVGRLSAS